MSKILIISIAATVIMAGIAYKAFAQNKAEEKLADTQNAKILIAYYSYSGNTKEVAEAIQKETGGDLFEITTEENYPTGYSQMTEIAKKQLAEGYRPKLTGTVENMAQYDIVFIGSPTWWGTITPQVSSFIGSYDLTGKTIIPFITHGGGGVSNTIKDMTAQCNGCKVVPDGWVGYGSRTMGLAGWLKDLGFEK